MYAKVKSRMDDGECGQLAKKFAARGKEETGGPERRKNEAKGGKEEKRGEKGKKEEIVRCGVWK